MIEIPGQVTSTCWGTTAVLACLTRQPLIGCQRAAENGVLIAQLALAQHYSSNGRNPGDRCNSYVWYSIAMQQLLQGWKDIAQEMTVDQVEEAEQRSARWLEFRGKKPVVRHELASTRCRSLQAKVSSGTVSD